MRSAILPPTAAEDQSTAFAVSFTGTGKSHLAISAYMLGLGNAVRAVAAASLGKVTGVFFGWCSCSHEQFRQLFFCHPAKALDFDVDHGFWLLNALLRVAKIAGYLGLGSACPVAGKYAVEKGDADGWLAQDAAQWCGNIRQVLQRQRCFLHHPTAASA